MATSERMRECRENRTKTVRWLGILLPLVLSYPILPVDGFTAWFKPRIIAAAAVWLILAFILLVRRDWRGAAAITAMYVVADAWWTLLAFRSLRAN